MASDLVALLAVSAVAVFVGVHDHTQPWDLGVAAQLGVLGVLLVSAALLGFRCWEIQVLGQGSEEFNRVYRAIVFSVMLLALGGMALKIDAVRPWVFGVVPMAGLTMVAARFAIRRALHRARRRDRCMARVLIVGTDDSVSELIARARRVPHHGWSVVAVCTSQGWSGHDPPTVADVPVVGDLDEVAHHVRDLGVDVVAIAPTPGWTPRRLHQLAWDLEGRGVELVVDPGLMEIGGPRLHVAPVDGLPLLRLTEPRFSGTARILKNATDRVAAALLLLVLLPLLVAVALLVKRDGGPMLYRQERIGLGGRSFRMIKFRSMAIGADRQLPALTGRDEGAGPLFKLRADPRVTRVGAVLRRYSLDELPQLANVLAGSMSLVGPRPPLASEVATYAPDARRRLLVRPGMTGLWQINGRSDLPWNESVRLDLRYVENWSPALDFLILWKTVGAVIRGRGAY